MHGENRRNCKLAILLKDGGQDMKEVLLMGASPARVFQEGGPVAAASGDVAGF